MDSHVPTQRDGGESAGGQVLADLAREVVGVHSRYFGRGPTRSKAIWRDELVVVMLGEIFTQAETMLVERGHFDEVRRQRQAFQDEVEPLFRNIVEQKTGRPVRSFLSQISPEGYASEVFVLESAE